MPTLRDTPPPSLADNWRPHYEEVEDCHASNSSRTYVNDYRVSPHRYHDRFRHGNDSGASYRAGPQHRSLRDEGRSSPTHESYRPQFSPRVDSLPSELRYQNMPKYFKQPMTCFYWATQGYCAKTDEECGYCHYFTGVIASAPVRVEYGGKAVAGREAVRRIGQRDLDEQLIRDQAAMLEVKKKDMDEAEDMLRQKTTSVRATIKAVYDAVRDLDETQADIVQTLREHRAEYQEMVVKTQMPTDSDALEKTMTIIDCSTASLAEFKTSIAVTTNRLKDAVGIVEDSFVPADNEHHEGAFSAAQSDDATESSMTAQEVDIFGCKIEPR